MPMLSRTEVGLVIAIWGQAWVRGADGMFRALKLGDTVHKGAVVLTAQDAIVQITREGEGDEPDATVAAVNKADALDAERAIEGINKGEADAAPAAGLGGGDVGDLAPGFRVERISEVAPAGALSRSAGGPDDIASLELLAGHEPEKVKSTTITEPPSSVDAVEEGPNVAVGVTMPAGATQVRIDGVPAVGQLLLADGTPVQAGATLTPAQLAGMVYVPPADYLPGTPVGDLRYSATVGTTTTVGSVGFNITAVNDAPVAAAGSASGLEDTTIPVSLTGSDVDGTIASVVIDRLPTIGTLLLADGVTPVLLGQTLTAAQASTLVLRPLPDQFGNDSIGFTVIDNTGAASTPGDWKVRITAVDDLPQANPDTFTVAEDGSVSINVRFNDGDVETPVLTITHVNGIPVTDGGPAVVVPNGTVHLLGGELVFTPAANYAGPANFNYTITDGVHTADAVVSGTVTPVDDLPIANPDAFV
ncbi:MAG TPA: Ig-like domain-containing protein, partial [Burkholderiaceae bacterium]|nr:Ig-like domain-containing protein [Burkholderiaceae bacterium]